MEYVTFMGVLHCMSAVTCKPVSKLTHKGITFPLSVCRFNCPSPLNILAFSSQHNCSLETLGLFSKGLSDRDDDAIHETEVSIVRHKIAFFLSVCP